MQTARHVGPTLFHACIPIWILMWWSAHLQICEILLILLTKRTLHKEFDSFTRLFPAYDVPSGYECVPHVWRGSTQVLYGYGIYGSSRAWNAPPPPRPCRIPSGLSWSRRQTVIMPDIGPVRPDMTLRPCSGPLFPPSPTGCTWPKILLTSVNN